MNVLCSATPCPLILSTNCVFYYGANLVYTGIATNDNLTTILGKIDTAIGTLITATGTVTSVNAIGSTGILVTGGPITSSGTFVITNTAPDQTVVLTEGTGIDITGTYPSFTITNTLPDQTVILTQGSGITITGTYPSFTISAAAGTGTVTSIGTTSPITGGTITTIGTIGITQSGAASDGYLSSGDWNIFNNKQPAGNYITALTGEATASGPGSVAITLTNSAVIGKVLTGLNVVGSAIVATDTILQAFGKVQNQINSLVGGLNYQGVWNASTNTPTLVSSVGTKGYYYKVSVAGNTNLDGITDWEIGDLAIFNGTVWDQIDNTDAVSSVNGYTAAVSLVTGDVLEGAGVLPGRPSNLYYTDARARAAISLTTTGTSGASTYNSSTGVFNIPDYGSALSGYVPYTGATGAVNLGAYNLTVHNITVGAGLSNPTLANPATIVGYEAGLSLTIDENENTAIGYKALRTLDVGFGNTAVGSNSMTSAATYAEYNTAVGSDSLWRLTTGVDNTAIGYSALDDVTTGSDNVALGYHAGNGLTTGSGNIFIGRQVEATTTMTNNIIIKSGGGVKAQHDGTNWTFASAAPVFTGMASGIVKSTAGVLSIATAGTDYLTPGGIPTGISATSPIFYNSGTGVISSQAASATVEGYVTTGAQTFAGNKTLTGALTGTTATFTDYLNVGTPLSGVTGVYNFVVSSANAGIYFNRIGNPAFIRLTQDNTGGGQLRSLSTDGMLFTATDTTEWARITPSGYDIKANLLKVGSNIGGSNSRTDTVAKISYITTPHYTNAEEDLLLINGSTSSGNNYVYVGGGWGSYNAATDIFFFTAGNSVTTTGTERLRINATALTSTVPIAGTSAKFNASVAGDWNTKIINSNATNGYGLYVEGANNASTYLLGLHNGAAYKFTVAGDGALTGTSATFSGDVTIQGASDKILTVRNTANTSSSLSQVYLGNDLQVFRTVLYQTGSTYTPSGDLVADGFTLSSGGVGGVIINARDAVGTVKLMTGSTTRYTIDASGNNTWTGAGYFGGSLEVKGTLPANRTSTAVMDFSGGTTRIFGFGASGVAGGIRFFTGVGATSSQEVGTFTSGGFFKASSDGTYFTASGLYHEFRGDAADWITRTSNKNANPQGLTIEYTSATPNSTSNIFLYAADASAVRFSLYSNGGIANYSANNVNLSDENAKKDIVSMGSQWEIFKNIDFVKYKYKDQTHDDYNYGVIAQQVLKVAPHFVNTDGFGNTKMLSVYDSDIHYSAHKALQEALIRIEEQDEKIKILEDKLNILLTKL